MTSTVTYKGALRTQAVHVKSGTSIVTDAPTDNNGKGEAFSPTDLVATALGSCLITIMGILANKEDINIDEAHLEITKIMASNPRRIAQVDISVKMPNRPYTESQKNSLEKVARTCPVALSLHADLVQNIVFLWGE